MAGKKKPDRMKCLISLTTPLIFFLLTTFCYSAEIDAIKAAINLRGAKWVAEENPVSSLPKEERRKRLGAFEDEVPDKTVSETLYAPQTADSLPIAFDWRNISGNSYVTPIRDQRSCGSCWAFAATAALESKALMAFNWPGANVDLSEQIVISCSGAGSCSGGSPSRASNFFRDTGIGLESCYPYTATNGDCGSACSDWENSTYRIESWSYISAGNTPTTSAIKNAIYNSGPIIAIFDVYTDFFSYRSGVYSYVSGEDEGGHAVLIVGWNDSDNAFIVKNSWGTWWGESGYFKIAYSELTGTTKFAQWAYAYGDPYFTASVTSTLYDYDWEKATDVSGFHLPSDRFFVEYLGNLGSFGWGGNDSMPLVWDYNGDGKSEISIYHIPTNQWFVKGVPGDNLGAFGWGQDESIPVPGDYDGDGVIERAFYHWPTNRWFVEGAGGSFTAYDFGWGGADCIPIALDYDGNGTTDMMLYHIPTNQWFVYGIGNLGQFGWNGSECIPVPGDWDGDGKIEIGIYHWPTNQWFWRDQNGTDHFLGQYGWGGMASFPIPGDYNGDGVMERAFYRPSENRWFIEGESDFIWGWGTSNFMPITSQIGIYNWFRFVLGMFQ